MKTIDFRFCDFVIQLVNNRIWDDMLYWKFEAKMLQISKSISLDRKELIEYKKKIMLLLLEISITNISNIKLTNKKYNADNENYVDIYARFERIKDLCYYMFYNKKFNTQNYDYKL